MKPFFCIVFFALVLAACQPAQEHQNHTQSPENQVVSDTAKGSPKRTAMANIGNAHVHIEYSSPAVRKRTIWGGLVALDAVWVTGAHKATSISFSEDVKIANQIVPKGKYAFFTIPSKDRWTLILNKNWEQHLADEYSEKDDILRWQAQVDSVAHTERLTYQVVPKGDKNGSIEIIWEKVKVSFEVQQVP